MSADRLRAWIGAACLLLLVACAAGESPSGNAVDPAVALAHRVMIVDTHIDVPYRLRAKPDDVSQRTADGDFDYPRAREGGLDVAFMSIYVPAEYEGRGGAKEHADASIDLVEAIAAEHPGEFMLVHSVAEARQAFAEGKLGLALGMENGAPIEGDLANLEHFQRRGIRYITLAHSKSNHICDSSYDEERRWHGLSPFGRELVAEMNRRGVMIDVSHVTDEAFDQVIELTAAPVIASHSSCRHFTPGWERNMSDESIRELAAHGGVIQINFGSSFLDDDYRRQREQHWREIEHYLEEHHIAPDSSEAEAYGREYLSARPVPVADLDAVVAHIDHVVQLVGVDYVGLGSDFDGVGDSLPIGLEDVSGYPNLIRRLLARGYSEADVEKICGGNLLRVWSEVERVAAASGTGS